MPWIVPKAKPVARDALPYDVWTTNGGVYLGYTVEGRTDPLRPLQRQEEARTVRRNELLRSTWISDGKRNLFQGEGNIALFGAQGSGKSRKLFMPNLIKLRDWSLIVMDTKGELTAHTAVWRAKREGHRVYVVDPFGVIKRNYPKLYAKYPEIFESHGFNPIAALDPNSDGFVDDTKALALALITTEGTKEIHFPQGAQALAKGLMMAIRMSTPGRSDNLAVLRQILGQNGPNLATLARRYVGRFGGKYPAISNSLNEFLRYSVEDRELNGIRRTANIQTDWLDSPLIARDLTRNKPIDFASYKDQPQTCYFVLPPDRLEDYGVWLRLMISGALRPLMRSVERAAVPVMFMLDETATLGNLALLSKNMGQMRGFGIKLWTVWQDLSQIQPIYGDEWKKILSLSEVKITFTTGHDVETGEYFSRLSGERLYKHNMKSTSKTNQSNYTSGDNSGWSSQGLAAFPLGSTGGTNTSHSSGSSISKSKNETFQSERTVKPYELAALNADEAVVFSLRGKIEKSLCPQPGVIPQVGEIIERARADIEGREPMPTITLNGPAAAIHSDARA